MTTPNSIVSDELEPCPFCGGDAEMNVLDGDAAGSTKLYAIDCSELDCGALMSAQHDREVAIQRWNRRSLSTGTDAGVREAVLRALRFEDKNAVFKSGVKVGTLLSALEQQPAASQEVDVDEIGECRYCANTGWFYGDPDLDTYCGCDFGKLRQSLSTPTSKDEVSERIAELEAALEAAAKRFHNIRGAVETNQVVDKDVHGSAIRGRDACRAALTGKGAGVA